MPNNNRKTPYIQPQQPVTTFKFTEEQESLIYEFMDNTDFRCSDLPWSPTAEELETKLFDGFDHALIRYAKEKEPRARGRYLRLVMHYILYAIWLSETCDDMDPRAYHKLQDWLKRRITVTSKETTSRDTK